MARIEACRVFVRDTVAAGEPVCGATTEFGSFAGFVDRATATEQCDTTLNHLSTGHGPDVEPAVVRATVLARLWSVTRGRSGVSPRW